MLKYMYLKYVIKIHRCVFWYFIFEIQLQHCSLYLHLKYIFVVFCIFYTCNARYCFYQFCVSVRPSVRPTVQCQYCVKTNGYIVKRL